MVEDCSDPVGFDSFWGLNFSFFFLCSWKKWIKNFLKRLIYNQQKNYQRYIQLIASILSTSFIKVGMLINLFMSSFIIIGCHFCCLSSFHQDQQGQDGLFSSMQKNNNKALQLQKRNCCKSLNYYIFWRKKYLREASLAPSTMDVTCSTSNWTCQM